MAVLLLILLGTAFLFSVVTYAVYWYEVLNLDRTAFDPDAHGGRRRLAVSGLASSVASQVTLYLTYAFGLLGALARPAAGGDKTKPPVLMVHGLYHNPSAWLLYRRWLRRRGYATLHSFSYSSFGPSFAAIADALGRKIREVSDENQGAKVVLIGHSLGGLLIKAALGDPEIAARAAAVVTLGTPYRGSKLAVLGLGALSAELIPGSPRCAGQDCFPDAEQIPWLCLASPADNMVLPPAALVPAADGPVYRVSPAVCHIGMLYHKPTAAMAIAFIDERLRGRVGGAA